MRLSEAATVVKKMLEFNMAMAKEGALSSSRVLVPYLEGPPGLGKTSVIEQTAAALGGRCEVIRLCDYEPSDLSGWVVADPNQREGEVRMIQCRPNWIPDADEGPVIVFFDELPQGSTSCQNAAAQVINERRIGQFELPPNAMLVAAGNGAKDRAGTNHMPTHLADRLTFLHIEYNPDDMCNYFAQTGVDSRVTSFLRFKPNRGSEFDRNQQCCPSPRSWERVSSILKSGITGPMLQTTIGGQVGEAAAADFSAYLKLSAAVPDMDKLLANPDKADIPTDAGMLFAVASAVGERINEKDGAAAIRYLTRIPRKEIAAYAISDAHRRDKNLVNTLDAMRQWWLTEGQAIFLGQEK